MSDLSLNKILLKEINNVLQNRKTTSDKNSNNKSVFAGYNTNNDNDSDDLYGNLISLKGDEQTTESKNYNNFLKLYKQEPVNHTATDDKKEDDVPAPSSSGADFEMKPVVKEKQTSPSDKILLEKAIRETEKAKKLKEEEKLKEEKLVQEEKEKNSEEYKALLKELKTITKNYYEKMTNRQLILITEVGGSSNEIKKENMTYSNLINNLNVAGKYRLADNEGNIVVASVSEIPKDAKQTNGSYYSENGEKYVVMSQVNSADYFQKALRNKEIIIQQAKTDDAENTWVNIGWNNIAFISDVYYTEDDADAEKEYKEKINALYEKSSMKVVLDDMDTVAEKYIDKEELKKLEEKCTERLNNRIFNFVYTENDDTKTETLSYYTLSNAKNLGEFRYADSDGNIVVASSSEIPEASTKIGDAYYTSDGKKYIIKSELKDFDSFQNLLREGEIKLQKKSTNNEEISWEDISWEACSFIQDALFIEDDVAAEAEYEYETARLKEEAYLKYLSE